MEDIMGRSKPGASQREGEAPPDPASSLPHDDDREGRQPYAKEVEDYKHGVIAPPDEQVEPDSEPEAPGKRRDE